MADTTTRDAARREKNRAMMTAIGDKYAPQMDALEAPVAAGRHGIPLSPVRHVDPKTLLRNPKNSFASLSDNDLFRLLQDIEQRGVLVPLIVASDRRTILAGHNRLRVALDLGLDRVPVQYVETALDEAAERRLLVADNVLRRQLTDSERAAYLAELYPEYFDGVKAGRKAKSDHGDPISAAEVAKAVGVSEPTIKRAKAIHKAAAENAAVRGASKPVADDYKAAKSSAKKSHTDKPPATLEAILDDALQALSEADTAYDAIEYIRDRCLESGLIR